MATVYSLVCWGGRTGKTVSISASTDVVTLTNHGLRYGTKLWPSGTLPSELNTSTPVYARSTAENTFTLHTSSAGAIANTGQITFAGASTYAAVVLKSDLVASPSTALSAYGLSDLSRWGASGSERIYDGLAAWVAGRAGASGLDEEICELGEAFTNTLTTTLTINTPAGAVLVTSKINDIRSTAWHGGSATAGFKAYQTLTSAVAISLTTPKTVLEGFVFAVSSGFYAATGMFLGAFSCTAKNIISIGPSVTYGIGISLAAAGCRAINCVSYSWLNGYRLIYYQAGLSIELCTATKCGVGVSAYASGSGATYATVVNTVSLGNTTNWSTGWGGAIIATNNAGGTGEAWATGTGTRVEITEASPFAATFVDHANNNFIPITGSALIDAGTDYYGSIGFDVADAVRPNYNNGGPAVFDIGAFEFDHGYGPWPASHILTFTNVVVGSRILIRDQADTTTHYSADAESSTVVIPITVYSDSRDNWRIRIRKATASPFYQPFETLMTAVAGESSLYISQIPDE